MTDDVVSSGPRAAGRDEAIAALFCSCYPELVGVGFAMVGDWDVAEQLVQEAFLRLWRRWRWIRDPGAAPAYLRQTVVNLSRATIRRRILERRTLASGDRLRPGRDPAGDLELHDAIAALPARRRACVVLRYLVGMSEAETAALLGVTPGTVKSQTHKALAQLRQELNAGGAAAGAAHGTDLGDDRGEVRP